MARRPPILRVSHAAGNGSNWKHPGRKAAMKLTQAQIDTFNREGWLFLPELFSPEEIEVLREEAANVLASNRQEIWREKNGAPRTAFAAHTYNEAFSILGRHPRMIEPV